MFYGISTLVGDLMSNPLSLCLYINSLQTNSLLLTFLKEPRFICLYENKMALTIVND